MTKLRSRAWYLYVLAVVGLTLVALAVAEIGPPTSSARTSTQILTAANGVVQSTVSGSGNVEPGTDMNANFQTSGTLSNVYVKVGQHVNKGQLLATLNSSTAQLALDQAEQNLTAAEDQLSSAESSSSTTTTSSGSGSGSGGSSTSSAGSVPSAQAAVDSAEASVQSATTALSDTKLYAPTSGTIASMAGLSVGDAVSAGSTSSASASSTGGSSTSSTGSSSTGGGAGATSAGSLGGSSSRALLRHLPGQPCGGPAADSGPAIRMTDLTLFSDNQEAP